MNDNTDRPGLHDNPASAPGIGTAMIFAAGLGTRFKPWTDPHPKALALVNGKSLLQRNVEYLQRYGIHHVIINTHHFADQVLDAIAKNDGWGSDIIISDERHELLETGGGLLHAKKFFPPGQPLVTCNVDILTDLDLYKLVAFHEETKPLISFGITDRKTSRYFLFDGDNRLCGWRNAKTGQERIVLHKPNLVERAYSCVAIFEPEIFSLIPFTGKFSLVDVYLELAANHLILGYEHTGDTFVDVGKPGNVALAESLFP